MEKIEVIQKLINNFFKFRYLPKKDFGKISKKLAFFEDLEIVDMDMIDKMAENIEPILQYDPKQIKRLTYVDQKYFSNIFKD